MLNLYMARLRTLRGKGVVANSHRAIWSGAMMLRHWDSQTPPMHRRCIASCSGQGDVRTADIGARDDQTMGTKIADLVSSDPCVGRNLLTNSTMSRAVLDGDVRRTTWSFESLTVAADDLGGSVCTPLENGESAAKLTKPIAAGMRWR